MVYRPTARVLTVLELLQSHGRMTGAVVLAFPGDTGSTTQALDLARRLLLVDARQGASALSHTLLFLRGRGQLLSMRNIRAQP